MDRFAAFQAAICTLAVSAISASVSTFVVASNTGALTALQGLAAGASLATGSWLVYVGHCRSLLPKR